MKKAVTLMMAVILSASVFAENVFEGKMFFTSNGGSVLSTDSNGKDLYKFKSDKTFEYACEEGILFGKYKIDEKKKTVAFSMEKLPADLFDIPGLSGKALSKSQILGYINDKDFMRNSMNMMLEEKFGMNPGIDLEKDDAADQIINFIFYKQLEEFGKVEGEFDKGTDYKKILLTAYNEMNGITATDEDFENAIELMRKEIRENLTNSISTTKKIESHINCIFDTTIIFDYSKDENGNIQLKESAKNVPVKNLFFSINGEDYEKRICINNGLLAVIETSDDGEPTGMTFYTTKDSFKKDSGKITFISTADKKNKIQAAYSVSRTDSEAAMTITFTTEKFKGAEFKSAYNLATEQLTETK